MGKDHGGNRSSLCLADGKQGIPVPLYLIFMNAIVIMDALSGIGIGIYQVQELVQRTVCILQPEQLIGASGNLRLRCRVKQGPGALIVKLPEQRIQFFLRMRRHKFRIMISIGQRPGNADVPHEGAELHHGRIVIEGEESDTHGVHDISRDHDEIRTGAVDQIVHRLQGTNILAVGNQTAAKVNIGQL